MTVWLSIEETREAIENYLRKCGLKIVDEVCVYEAYGSPAKVGEIPVECDPIKAVKSVR